MIIIPRVSSTGTARRWIGIANIINLAARFRGICEHSAASGRNNTYHATQVGAGIMGR
jgi:hypothetical protein